MIKTKYLDKAYKKLSDLYTEDIKDKIKNGSTRAYLTGDLYRSVSTTVKPISTGKEISTSMLSYYEYTNDGTKYIQPPRQFLEAGIKETEQRLDELLGDAAVEDIAIAIDQTLND